MQGEYEERHIEEIFLHKEDAEYFRDNYKRLYLEKELEYYKRVDLLDKPNKVGVY